MHPTTGEMVDRLVLLKLKIESAIMQKLPSEHFEQEYEEIKVALDAVVPAIALGKLISLISRMVEIHKLLWMLVPEGSTKVLLDANRKRHEIREEIDRLTGEFKGKEKV